MKLDNGLPQENNHLRRAPNISLIQNPVFEADQCFSQKATSFLRSKFILGRTVEREAGRSSVCKIWKLLEGGCLLASSCLPNWSFEHFRQLLGPFYQRFEGHLNFYTALGPEI